MAEFPAERQPNELPRDPNLRIPFPLDSPCASLRLGVICNSADGYIRPNPYGVNRIHYSRRCLRCDEFVDHIKAPRLALHLGINLKGVSKQKLAEVFDPRPRIAPDILLRDNRRCVYFGCEQGKTFADGTTIICGADHLIPKRLLVGKKVEAQQELYEFARHRQLVTACERHNSAKGSSLASYDSLERLFVDIVQRGADNRLELYLLRRLYQIALNPPPGP